MNKKSIPTIFNISIDICFLAAAVAIESGLALLSGPANAMLLFLLYYVFLYLYRYVFIHQIGTGARPLFIQLGIKLPRLIDYPLKGVFIVMVSCFPALILTLCLHIAQPVLQFDSGKNPILPALTGMFIVFTLIINSIIFYVNSMPHKKSLDEGGFIDEIEIGMKNIRFFPGPDKTIRNLLSHFIIPLASVLTIASISNVKSAWFSLEDPGKPWELLLMTLGAFIPFRYLILRIIGVSYLSLFSLLMTAILISIFYLY